MKKSVLVLVLLIGLAVVVAVVLTGLFGRREGVSFRLVYNARTLGYLVPLEEFKGGRWLGGFGRRATLIKQSSASPRTFVVDAGGFFGDWRLGTFAYREALARYTLKGMARTGVEVCNVDVIDQMWGEEKLMEYVSEVSFPFVSASLVDVETDRYVFEPFRVIEKDGLRVAFVGVMDPQYIALREIKQGELDRKLPPTVQRPELRQLPSEGEGFRVLALPEAFKRVAPLLEGKADVVVVLGTSGGKAWEALRPYRDGKLFNMVLAASGKPAEEPMLQGNIPVFMTGLGGTYVAIVDALYRGSGQVEYTRWNPVPLDESVPEDPELAGLAGEMRKSLAEVDPRLLIEKIYKSPGDEKYVGATACARCHEREHEIWRKGPHATAIESLRKTGALYDPRCLACHVGDYQAVDGYVSEKATPKMAPITCELCHGRGSIHVKLEGEGADAKLRNPDPPRCRICHDVTAIRKSGFHGLDPAARFDYNTFWPRIRHGRGRSPRGAQEPAPEAK